METTAAIKADTEDIKQDTQQIDSLVQEIAFLRLQISQLPVRQESGSAGLTLQRFLDETSSYAESVVDIAELGDVDLDDVKSLAAITEEDSDVDLTDEPDRPAHLVSESREAGTQESPAQETRSDYQIVKREGVACRPTSEIILSPARQSSQPSNTQLHADLNHGAKAQTQIVEIFRPMSNGGSRRRKAPEAHDADTHDSPVLTNHLELKRQRSKPQKKAGFLEIVLQKPFQPREPPYRSERPARKR